MMNNTEDTKTNSLEYQRVEVTGVRIMDNTEDFYSSNMGSIPVRRAMHKETIL